MAFGLKQYQFATELLIAEFEASKNESDKGRIAYLTGKSYQILNQKDHALKWLQKANDLEYGYDAVFALAEAYKQVEQYENAIQAYEKLNELEGAQKYAKEIKICQEVAKWKLKYKDHYTIEELAANSEYNDYGAVYYEDNFMVFSSDRLKSTGDYIYEWTGNDFSDLFVLNANNQTVYDFEAIFNTEDNEGAACFNQDFTEVFFTRCVAIKEKDDHCRIYYSNREDGYWTDPRPLLFFDEKTNYGHPCLIENDSVLVLSVETDLSNGYHDLFYSVRTGDGWSSPDAMPDYINTAGDEVFPTAFNDTLYFSSSEHPGMGGLDIFKIYLRKDRSWSKPENMKYPINSGADDFGFVVDPRFEPSSKVLRKGYFSSSRNTSDDIFRYQQLEKVLTAKEEADKVRETEKKNETPKEKELFLAIKVVEHLRLDDNPNQKISGKSNLPSAQLKINGTLYPLNKQATHVLKVELDKSYTLVAEYKDYLRAEKVMNTSNVEYKNGESVKTINVELALDKIYYDVEINLDNIYYDYDKWDIRSDAEPTLDSLVTLMRLNPTLNVQMGSHTDCRGEVDYNEELSQNRAEAAVEYLYNKGVNISRLSAKGFGESAPIAACDCNSCSEAQHQANRRTTFKIIK